LSAAQALLNEYVADDFPDARVRDALSVVALRAWPAPRRRAVIRYWLQHHDVLMPSTRVLQSLEHDMLNSADDRVPCTRWGEYAVHRYRDQLHLETRYRPEHIDQQLEWNWRNPLILPHQLGSLALVEAADSNRDPEHLLAASLPSRLTVHFRRGGERLQLSGEPFHRDLKNLLADAGVLPWWRGRIPMIFAGDELVAVAGLWVSANFVATNTQPALQLQWLHDAKAVFFDK
jgi:tRNA(Ile)-lysidine synthase